MPGGQVPRHELEDVPVIRADHVGDGAAVRAEGIAGVRADGAAGGSGPDQLGPAPATGTRQIETLAAPRRK